MQSNFFYFFHQLVPNLRHMNPVLGHIILYWFLSHVLSINVYVFQIVSFLEIFYPTFYISFHPCVLHTCTRDHPNEIWRNIIGIFTTISEEYANCLRGVFFCCVAFVFTR
jgi:hypothetical protein